MVSWYNAIIICLFVFVSLRFWRVVANHVGLVDQPGGRKNHEGSVPVIGGIIVFLGIILGCVLETIAEPIIGWAMLGCTILLIVGLIDDFKGLKPSLRLLVEIAVAASIVYMAGLSIPVSGSVFGVQYELGAAGNIITIVLIVGMINAFNMLDGVDGVASTAVFIAMLGLVGFQLLTGENTHFILSGVIVVSMLVYYFNNIGITSKRKIFLGDSGSMLLGYLVTVLLVDAAQRDHSITSFSAVDIAWCVALPLFDTLTVMIRRMVKKKSPFYADRTHIHHILQRSGFNNHQTLFIISVYAFVILLIGLFVKAFFSAGSFFLIVLLGFLYLGVFLRAWKVTRFVRRFRK